MWSGISSSTHYIYHRLKVSDWVVRIFKFPPPFTTHSFKVLLQCFKLQLYVIFSLLNYYKHLYFSSIANARNCNVKWLDCWAMMAFFCFPHFQQLLRFIFFLMIRRPPRSTLRFGMCSGFPRYGSCFILYFLLYN